MSNKNQTFAFIVGEVSPAFYGRLDLQKYPFGLSTVENFLVDYRGGVLNRPGSEFVAMLLPQAHRFARFRARGYDIALFFTANKMRVLKDGKFIHEAEETGGTISSNVVTATNTLAVGQLVWLDDTVTKGYFSVTARTAGTFTISSPIGDIAFGTNVVWAAVYERSTTFTADELAGMKFSQDLKRIVCTNETRLPTFIERIADNNWSLSVFLNVLPAAPVNLVGVASAAGAASVGFAVTAVIGGVESSSSVELVSNAIVNYTSTSGHFTLSWDAVVGAERYNVYRSQIYPTAYPTGAQLGYIGYTKGLSFVDRNITADYTKTVPELVDFFAGNNYPAVYTRFQQRGVYGGFVNDPLTVVGSMGTDKDSFSISFPTIPTDSYSYTLDAESERPIKHMLPLRYGLMLFTDDGITQLRGGDGTAISATSAVAEPQGSVSVSDLDPTAINLDVLFMTSLSSELNQMVYTEYSNSFKMQDILALSSHLFGADQPAIRMAWAAEPHKLLYFVRADGQRVTLTYERNLEVYGWSRYITRGSYLDLCVVREDSYNLAYQSVRREILQTETLFIEREKPRQDIGYERMWYVDAGTERPLIRPNYSATLIRLENDDVPNYLDSDWKLQVEDVTWAEIDQIVYAQNGMFRVKDVQETYLLLAPMVTPTVSTFYESNKLRLLPGSWGYNNLAETVSGLWWLEGETVSILHDGDATLNVTVTNGSVTVVNASAHFTIGMAYNARIKTLPLSLPNYILGGTPLTLRSIAFRQNNSRGLSVGDNFSDMEELPSRRDENWGNPLSVFTELTVHDLWGAGGWVEDKLLCFEQKYPLPSTLLGFTFDLDVGD